MNRLQYLLGKLAEESSEISQISLKTSYFGMDAVYESETNVQLIHNELNDLNGIIRMLNDEFNFSYTIDESKIKAKIKNVNNCYNYGIECGMIYGNIINTNDTPINVNADGFHSGGMMDFLLSDDIKPHEFDEEVDMKFLVNEK